MVQFSFLHRSDQIGLPSNNAIYSPYGIDTSGPKRAKNKQSVTNVRCTKLNIICITAFQKKGARLVLRRERVESLEVGGSETRDLQKGPIKSVTNSHT